jgi:hypothetical protein
VSGDLAMPPGRAERLRRATRVQLPESARPEIGETKGSDLFAGTAFEGVFRPEVRERLARILLDCLCGWTGGYADMEPDHHRCPRCKTARALDRVPS